MYGIKILENIVQNVNMLKPELKEQISIFDRYQA